jgi:hypothetical protein
MFIESLLILFCDSRDLPLVHHQTMVYYGVDDLSVFKIVLSAIGKEIFLDKYGSIL